MLTTTVLGRVFEYKKGGQVISLPDPSPVLTPQQVMSHYTSIYPELLNAKIEGPTQKDDNHVYSFGSVSIGNKG